MYIDGLSLIYATATTRAATAARRPPFALTEEAALPVWVGVLVEEVVGEPEPVEWVVEEEPDSVADPDGLLVPVGETVPVMAVPVTDPVSEVLPEGAAVEDGAPGPEEEAVGQTAESGTLTPTPPQIPLANWMVSTVYQQLYVDIDRA